MYVLLTGHMARRHHLAYLRSIFNRKSIFWFVCALVLWLALFIDLVISVRSENSSFSYSFAGDSDRGSLPVDVSIKVSQSWDDYIGDVQIKGAEYDGTVVNGSGKEIRNWILTIKLPESDGQIDSSWNGTYEKTGNAIDYYPDKNVYVIEKDSFRTFGFILKSAEVIMTSLLIFRDNMLPIKKTIPCIGL